jgi:hypothetical protein
MWYIILKKGNKLNVPENKVLRSVFVAKKNLRIAVIARLSYYIAMKNWLWLVHFQRKMALSVRMIIDGELGKMCKLIAVPHF